MRKTCGLLFLSSLSLTAFASNELILFVYPPIKKINWQSPSSAMISTGMSDIKHLFKNKEWNKSIVGHVVVRYHCQDSEGQWHDVWSGVSGQNDTAEDKDDLLRKKIGLSILFKNYRDGEVQSEPGLSRNKVANYIGRHVSPFQRAHPRYLRFGISREQCDEIHDYHSAVEKLGWDKRVPLAKWRERRDDQLLFFGFNFKNPHLLWKQRRHDPRIKIGAGCTEFGTSFLKLMGRFETAFENFWRRDLRISYRYMGGEMGGVDATTGKTRQVGLGELLTARSWEVPGWSNRPLYFYDTELMWQFLVDVEKCEQGGLKNCSQPISAWVQKHSSRLQLGTYRVLADRLRRTFKNIGTAKNPTYVVDKEIPYQTWVQVAGVTLN